ARPAEAEPDLSAIAADAAGKHAVSRPAVYVYEVPVRICHWVNAFTIIVLMVTGYLIGTPLPSVEGEASANFVMGYIRFAHFAAGDVLAVFFLGRILWAFVGNHHFRQIFYLPVYRNHLSKQVLHELRRHVLMGRVPWMNLG